MTAAGGPGEGPVMDERAFRDTLGYYASGITVISGLTAAGSPAGFTCQSFYSVSIAPPLVSFSAATSSTTYPLIRDVRRFAVNVLAGDQHEVASQFARSGTDKWAGVQWRCSPNGSPLIDGALMWLDCDLVAEHAAGDHVIVVGRVLHMSPRDCRAREPLLYFKGRFRHLSPPREPDRGERGEEGRGARRASGATQGWLLAGQEARAQRARSADHARSRGLNADTGT